MSDSIALPDSQYATVVIDPPWPANGFPTGNQDGKGNGRNGPPIHRDFDYSLMSVDELAALEIPSILANDAIVFLWTINRFVKDGFALLDAWGLDYMFLMAWVKPHGPKPVGYPIYNMEQILVARKGRPNFTETTDFRTATNWDAPVNPHAAPGAWGRQIANCTKPEGFYSLLRRVTPEPRLDMFARRWIAGFTPWGNEVPEQPNPMQDNLF